MTTPPEVSSALMEVPTARDLLVAAFRLRFKNMRFINPEEEVDALLGVVDIGGFAVVPKGAESKRDVRNEALEEAALVCEGIGIVATNNQKRLPENVSGHQYHRGYAVSAYEAAAAIRSLLNAPEQNKASLPEIQNTIPEGWKMVPREPTEAMIQTRWPRHDNSCLARDVWLAMFDASPLPPNTKA